MFPRFSATRREFDAYILLDSLYGRNLKETADMLSPFADVNSEVTLRIEILCNPRRPATYWQPAEGGPELNQMGVVYSGNRVLWIDNQNVIDELSELFDEDMWEQYEDEMSEK
jgi:hypothetical protein